MGNVKSHDELGTRMKSYEEHYDLQMHPLLPIFVRVDGRAFHTYTRDLEKPFDSGLIEAMRYATAYTADNMQNFCLAYTQSDEATFMMYTEENEALPWFGGRTAKIISLSASMFTFAFLTKRAEQGAESRFPAVFDARAFTLPIEDAPNMFVWREKDWVRNSVSMLGFSHFTHERLLGKSKSEVITMLEEKGVFWNELPERLKNGSFYFKKSWIETYLDYAAILTMIKNVAVKERNI